MPQKNVDLNIKQSIADANLSRFTNENTPGQKGVVGENVQVTSAKVKVIDVGQVVVRVAR